MISYREALDRAIDAAGKAQAFADQAAQHDELIASRALLSLAWSAIAEQLVYEADEATISQLQSSIRPVPESPTRGGPSGRFEEAKRRGGSFEGVKREN